MVYFSVRVVQRLSLVVRILASLGRQIFASGYVHCYFLFRFVYPVRVWLVCRFVVISRGAIITYFPLISSIFWHRWNCSSLKAPFLFLWMKNVRIVYDNDIVSASCRRMLTFSSWLLQGAGLHSSFTRCASIWCGTLLSFRTILCRTIELCMKVKCGEAKMCL